MYECLSSSPECDSNLELRHGAGGGFRAACKRKSDSSAMENGAEKFHHQPFVRSTSLPYCGSETESELYAPYTFYAGDEVHRPSSDCRMRSVRTYKVKTNKFENKPNERRLRKQGAEEDQDWKSRDDEPKMSRLRQRRGRSIVHRSLEDNYGAVVVANHEALAQFLEQVRRVFVIFCRSTRINYFQKRNISHVKNSEFSNAVLDTIGKIPRCIAYSSLDTSNLRWFYPPVNNL